MKHTEKRAVERIETFVVKVTCDICHEEIRREHDSVGDGCSAEEVTVEHKTGHSYPEGGSGETVLVDICPKCFDERLVPWLQSQGAEPRKEEWSW